MAETYDPCELDTAPLGGHDDLCEAEFIHGPMAWSPCRCAERAVADPKCPTCGPTTLEPHSRRTGVMRCTNCKEHLSGTPLADPTPETCRSRRRCPIPDDPCGFGGPRPYCWETTEAEHFHAAAAALDQVGEQIRNLRLDLAIRRDNRMTREETIAMIGVYQEFGR